MLFIRLELHTQIEKKTRIYIHINTSLIHIDNTETKRCVNNNRRNQLKHNRDIIHFYQSWATVG